MSKTIRTLVVDDEPVLCLSIAGILRRAGHDVATAGSGEDALIALRDTPFDLVLLDLRLGGRLDGLKVLEGVRWRWPQTAVIILTAFGSLESALAAIQEGVDGYLLKPVEAEQLLHAVGQALTRRGHMAAQEKEPIMRWGPLAADPDKHVATFAGRPLELTPREFKLLAYLIQNGGRVISTAELVQVVQGYRCEDDSEARQLAKWYVHRLRQKIEPDPVVPRYLQNVRGVGYLLTDAAEASE